MCCKCAVSVLQTYCSTQSLSMYICAFLYLCIKKYILFILQSHEKTYNCNVCGTSFGRKDVLTKHKKTHENGKQKESSDPPPPPPAKKQRIAEHYECNICSASFENVQELKDHFLTHQEESNEDEEESHDQEVPLMEKALGLKEYKRMTSYSCSVIEKMLLNILRMKLKDPMQ